MQKNNCLQNLLDQIGEPVLVCNEDGLVLFASEALVTLVGRGREWLSETPVDTWLQGSDGLLWSDLESVIERDLFFDVSDGARRRVGARISSLPMDGEMGWLIVLCPRSESAERLAGLQAVLGGLSEALRERLAGVLSGTSQALLDCSPEQAAVLRAIYADARDAALLQAQISALGRAPSKLKICSLGSLVHDASRRLAAGLGDNVQLETRLPARGDDLMADADALRMILLGTGEWMVRQGARQLRFQVFAGASLVRLSIAGDAPSISAEQRAMLFEPGGDGSILPLLPNIAARHGGRALVVEAGDGGVMLHLEFPRARARDDIEQAATILVIEDDSDLRAVVADLLKLQGYQVLSASNGVEASVTLRQRHGELDLMLTDAVLPGRSGVELIREARTLRPDLPVLLMTSYSPEFLNGRLQQDLPCLYKPFSPSELIARIGDLLKV